MEASVGSFAGEVVSPAGEPMDEGRMKSSRSMKSAEGADVVAVVVAVVVALETAFWSIDLRSWEIPPGAGCSFFWAARLFYPQRQLDTLQKKATKTRKSSENKATAR